MEGTHTSNRETEMNLQFTLRGIELDQSQTEVLRRKAEFAFSRCCQQLISMEVVLEDVNGPRGGDDKICRLILRFSGQPTTILEERGPSILAVASAAMDRAAHTLARRNEKVTRRRELTSAES